MMNEKLECRAMSAPWRSGVEVLLKCNGAYGRNVIMDTPINEGVSISPTFSLTMDSAQVLMDDLWNAGLRPTEGTGSAGALAATQKHLEDMRTIVFKDFKT